MTHSRQRGSMFSLLMIGATIVLLGVVAYRYIDASTNTEVAQDVVTPSVEVASVKKASDVDTLTKQLDNIDLNGSFDSDLSAALNF